MECKMVVITLAEAQEARDAGFARPVFLSHEDGSWWITEWPLFERSSTTLVMARKEVVNYA